ncbi:hypothetical protein D3C85_1350050 [compost metagenome]
MQKLDFSGQNRALATDRHSTLRNQPIPGEVVNSTVHYRGSMTGSKGHGEGIVSGSAPIAPYTSTQGLIRDDLPIHNNVSDTDVVAGVEREYPLRAHLMQRARAADQLVVVALNEYRTGRRDTIISPRDKCVIDRFNTRLNGVAVVKTSRAVPVGHRAKHLNGPSILVNTDKASGCSWLCLT